jgi:hypothetical protein
MTGTIGKRILTVAIGLFLAAGIPYVAATTLHADPGSGSVCKGPCGEKSGCGQECGHHEGCGPGCRHRGECPGCPDGAVQAVPPCMQDNASAVPGGMHRRMHGGGAPPMMEGMARHMEETRGTIAKLRALEAKMEALASKDDAAAFRAASLEHSKLLTDLQAAHLKHMEGMMGGK